jgi:hypothetical protein
MARISLPQVTLCAATSVNVAATVAAMQHSMTLCDFGAALLLTDQILAPPPEGIAVQHISNLESSAGYSRFILSEMVQYITTSHVLVVQWDGFVLHPEAWDPAFMEFDYIGAVWPQFDAAAAVGNGGFSLRSKRLLNACRAIGLTEHPEDVAICRTYRFRLEQDFDIRFADRETAARFSYERTAGSGTEFGFHGVFNLPSHLPADVWWNIYLGLDEAGSVFQNLGTIIKLTWRAPKGMRRAAKMIRDANLRQYGVKR